MKIKLFILMTVLSSQILAASPNITAENRPWTRWWWPASAVDSAGITFQMESFHQAGMGGVEITPIYGAKGYEDRFIDFLSPQWVDMLQFTLDEADRLGLQVDMNNGTGWPFGGPQITPELAACKVEIVELPADSVLLSPQKLLGVIVHDKKNKIITTDFKKSLSKLETQKVTAIYEGRTRQKVKRSAPGGEGWVMDHYSTLATDTYLDRFSETIPVEVMSRVRTIFNDSYEVYGANWTPDMFAEFEKRRGYKLQDHLDALAGLGDEDTIARVKSDYRETIGDLLLEHFTQRWTNWAHEQGTLTRNQAHGSPGNLLDLYATVDIPETEIFGPTRTHVQNLKIDPDFPTEGRIPPDMFMMKFASSAANITGKKLTSSESFTWLGEHFKTALSQCKPEIDHMFISGINHILFHGTCYSPQDAPWPGWLFYASVQFGPENSIWQDLPAMTEYITNCQNMLQNSTHTNDVLIYWPIYDIYYDTEGLMKTFTVHGIDEWLYPTDFYQTAKLLHQNGIAFDYISDHLLESVNVKDGQLMTAGGPYKTIIVPETRFMPVSTLEKLYSLAENGATVLFHHQYPQDVPGFNDLKNRRKSLKQCADKGAKITGNRFAVTDHILPDLDRLNVNKESLADSGLVYIKKNYNDKPFYFVSNLTSKPVNGWIPFNVKSESVWVWLWKPIQNHLGKGQIVQINDSESMVYLQIESGESVLLLFDFELPQEFKNLRKGDNPVLLTGPWDLEFTKGGPELPGSATIKSLKSWTALDDKECQRFAGTGKYITTFDKPKIQADEWQLDLGKVCESAKIRINGKDLGTVWCLPFNLTFPATLLKDKGNTLEIEVTNLSANRIKDLEQRGVEWKRFYEINFVNINYKPFDASAWELVPSGLLGPVQLVPMHYFKPDVHLIKKSE